MRTVHVLLCVTLVGWCTEVRADHIDATDGTFGGGWNRGATVPDMHPTACTGTSLPSTPTQLSCNGNWGGASGQDPVRIQGGTVGYQNSCGSWGTGSGCRTQGGGSCDPSGPVQQPVSSVPEPSTLTLAALGLLALGLRRRFA